MSDQEFVNFESALNELKLSEDQLKRLVSEGEIRAIRGENNTMKFRKEEIERLKQDTGKTIQYTEESSDTLTDDLLFDEADDLDVDEEGMATAQISSEDTFVGDDTGMTTAPLAASAPAPKTAVTSVRKSTGGRSTTSTVRRTTGRSTRMRVSAMEQEAVGIGVGVAAILVITFVVSAFGMFVWWDIAKDRVSSPTGGISSWAGQTFGGIEATGE
ncbi:MAG: hypothetical protein HRU14_09925 [Planctomycetes bacterium]|nr:hypothetical protein [Planctomycetota bacterium]